MSAPGNGQQGEHIQPQPAPSSWSIQPTSARIGGQPVYALTIYTVSGACVTFWPADGIIKMADMLRQFVSGLQVATDLPPTFPPS